MKVLLLTSDYHISANIGVRTFLENPSLMKNGIEVVGIILVDQLNFDRKPIERTMKFLRRVGFVFFVTSVFTNIWKQIGMSFGRRFLRSKEREYLSMREMAETRGIPLLQTDSVNSERSVSFIRERKPDLLVSCFLLEMVKKEVLDIAPKGGVNVHPALFQHHRGVFSSFWAMMKGWRKSGATVHYMTQKLDEGKVILQKRFFVHPSDTMHCINRKSATLGGNLLAKAVVRIKRNRVRGYRTKRVGQMFTVPGIEDVRSFYRRGKSLIKAKDFFGL